MNGHRNTANEWRMVCRRRASQIGGWQCEKCHRIMTERNTQGHHRWPKSLFGPNTVENCQLRCASCEKRDGHWLAKNERLVIDLLVKNELEKLRRFAPRGAFSDLQFPLSFYRIMVIESVRQRYHGNRFIPAAQNRRTEAVCVNSRFATTFS